MVGVSQRLASFASATAPQCGLAICWTGSSVFKVPNSNASACCQAKGCPKQFVGVIAGILGLQS